MRADEGHQDVEMVGLANRSPGARCDGRGRLVGTWSRGQLGCEYVDGRGFVFGCHHLQPQQSFEVSRSRSLPLLDEFWDQEHSPCELADHRGSTETRDLTMCYVKPALASDTRCSGHGRQNLGVRVSRSKMCNSPTIIACVVSQRTAANPA